MHARTLAGKVWDRLKSDWSFTRPFLEILYIFTSWGEKHVGSPALHPRHCMYALMAYLSTEVCLWMCTNFHSNGKCSRYSEGKLCPFPALFPFYFLCSSFLACLGDFCPCFTLGRRLPVAQTGHTAACWGNQSPSSFGINMESGPMDWNLKLLPSIRAHMATLQLRDKWT